MVFVATCCYYQSKHSILEFSYMIRTLKRSFVFACIGAWCVPCTLLPLVLTSIQIKLPAFRKSQQQAYKKVNKYLKEASTVAFPLLHLSSMSTVACLSLPIQQSGPITPWLIVVGLLISWSCIGDVCYFWG